MPTQASRGLLRVYKRDVEEIICRTSFGALGQKRQAPFVNATQFCKRYCLRHQ